MRSFNTRRKIASWPDLLFFSLMEIGYEHTEQQLESSTQSHGYRGLHQKCWLHGIVTHR